MFAKLLVYTEEIDLSHLNLLAIRGHCHGDARNEPEKIVFLAASHANNPVQLVTWRVERPLEEIHTIIESEIATIILNVMIGEKLVEFLCLCIICHIHSAPVITFRQG